MLPAAAGSLKKKGKRTKFVKTARRTLLGHLVRLVSCAPQQSTLEKLDDGWPESEERCSEICKSEDGIA